MAQIGHLLLGGVHGALQVIEKLFSINNVNNNDYHTNRNGFSVVATFVVVSMLWAFFRAESIQDALYVFRHCFDGIANFQSYLMDAYLNLRLGFSNIQIFTLPFSILVLFVFDYFQLDGNVFNKLDVFPTAVRWLLYYTIIIWILFFGSMGSEQFVYFQF